MRKGEVSITTIIIGILALIVAVVLMLGAGKIGVIKDTANNILPGYNGTKPLDVSAGVLRYNIEKVQIESYTGKEWVSESGRFIIGNYEVESGVWIDSFKSYYYQTPRKSYLNGSQYFFYCDEYTTGDAGKLVSDCSPVFYKLLGDYYGMNSDYPEVPIRAVAQAPVSDYLLEANNVVNGVVLLTLRDYSGQHKYGSVVIWNDNKAIFTPEKSNSPQDITEREYGGSSYLIEGVIDMRDSILEGGRDETAIVLPAVDRRTGQSVSLKVVPRRLQGELVVFLSEAE